MAHTVFDKEVISLQDDNATEVELKPLPLGLLKKVMKAWKKVADVENEEEIFEVYLNCTGICLSKELKGKFEQPLSKDGALADDYREYLEDTLDMPTIYKILDVCGGLKLNEENLRQAVEVAMEEVDGTN